MSAETKISETMSPKVKRVVDTGATDEKLLAGFERQRRENEAEWARILDDQLIEWGRNPHELEHDDIVAPSPDIISLASQVAVIMRDAGETAPTRVVPNGNGGIVFERAVKPAFLTIEIDEDGSVETATFVNSKMVTRQRLL